jgi:hypothetical protein
MAAALLPAGDNLLAYKASVESKPVVAPRIAAGDSAQERES